MEESEKLYVEEERTPDYHSDEVQEILGRQPSWIVRWGITVLISILVGFIIACCVIKYPQTVMASITLTAENPSSDLMARYAGILDTVSVSNGDTVCRGQILALIANAANYDDILWVERVFNGSFILEKEEIDWVAYCPEKQFGDMQSYWLELRTACRNYSDYLSIDQIGKKKRLIASQIQQTKKHYSILEKQRLNLEEELYFEHQSVVRDSILYTRNAISKSDYENTEKSYITLKNTLDGFDATLSNARLNQLQLEQQILELDVQQSAEKAEYERRISLAKGALLGQLSLWKEQYAIIAPFDGTVSLQNVWSKGQHVVVGDLIASVNPSKGTEVLGRLKVPSSGFGKVKEGQDVNIKLNGFPYLEFGILKGVVRSISAVPEKNQDGLCYTVNVELPGGLESTYHKTFPFVQDMDGTAEIITEDMRLLEQFIRPIRSLFVNR